MQRLVVCLLAVVVLGGLGLSQAQAETKDFTPAKLVKAEAKTDFTATCGYGYCRPYCSPCYSYCRPSCSSYCSPSYSYCRPSCSSYCSPCYSHCSPYRHCYRSCSARLYPKGLQK